MEVWDRGRRPVDLVHEKPKEPRLVVLFYNLAHPKLSPGSPILKPKLWDFIFTKSIVHVRV